MIFEIEIPENKISLQQSEIVFYKKDEVDEDGKRIPETAYMIIKQKGFYQLFRNGFSINNETYKTKNDCFDVIINEQILSKI